MIKRILFFFLVIAGIVSCKDDDNIGFNVPVEFPGISFKPVPGGAVMHYVLPDNLDIFGVRARYTNAFGEQLVKDGSYLTDTLLLGGFTEARTAEPVQLSFFNSEMQESAPIEMTFDTEAAACRIGSLAVTMAFVKKSALPPSTCPASSATSTTARMMTPSLMPFFFRYSFKAASHPIYRAFCRSCIWAGP